MKPTSSCALSIPGSIARRFRPCCDERRRAVCGKRRQCSTSSGRCAVQSEPENFQPIEMLRILAKNDVAYVLIGGLAAVLHGSPTFTNDADVCPSRNVENLHR